MPAQGLDLVLGFLQAHEPTLVQALLSQRTIEALHHGVIGRLAGSAEVELAPSLVGSLVDDLPDKFTAAYSGTARTATGSQLPTI